MTHYGRYWNRTETKRDWRNMAEHRPELDRNSQNILETTVSYKSPGLGNPHSYPCRHVRASDLWCRRRRDVTTSTWLESGRNELGIQRLSNHYRIYAGDICGHFKEPKPFYPWWLKKFNLSFQNGILHVEHT